MSERSNGYFIFLWKFLCLFFSFLSGHFCFFLRVTVLFKNLELLLKFIHEMSFGSLESAVSLFSRNRSEAKHCLTMGRIAASFYDADSDKETTLQSGYHSVSLAHYRN